MNIINCACILSLKVVYKSYILYTVHAFCNFSSIIHIGIHAHECTLNSLITIGHNSDIFGEKIKNKSLVVFISMFDVDEESIAMLDAMDKYMTKVTYNIVIYGIGISVIWTTISLTRIYFDYKRANNKKGD